jgi:hypothetical protein
MGAPGTAPGHLTGTTPHPCPLDHIAIDMCEFGGVLHSINELVSSRRRDSKCTILLVRVPYHNIPHFQCAPPAPGPGVTVKAV